MVRQDIENTRFATIFKAANFRETDMENMIPAASVEAWRQLVALNLQRYQPEVESWLHSEEAEPVLQQLLANVPCSRTLH